MIVAEKAGYTRAASQPSFFDAELAAIDPSPFAFSFSFQDSGGRHTFRCGDWETHTMFWKWSRELSETHALQRMSEIYNDEYPTKGMVFAVGTVKARPKQWILLGVIRLDRADEPELDL